MLSNPAAPRPLDPALDPALPARPLAAPSALLLVAAAAAACSPQPAPPSEAGSAPVPLAATSPSEAGGSAAPATPPGAGQPEPGPPWPMHPGRATGGEACRLSAPVRSDDACSTDADCGPSSPCHAKTCVAAAKAQRPAPSILCTQSLECDSIDVNRCGCLEGRCALIPPPPG